MAVKKGKAKPMLRFVLNIDLEVKHDGEGYLFSLFGQERFVCPNHRTREAIKKCILSEVMAAIEYYGLEKDSKLAPDAIKLKHLILKSVVLREADTDV